MSYVDALVALYDAHLNRVRIKVNPIGNSDVDPMIQSETSYLNSIATNGANSKQPNRANLKHIFDRISFPTSPTCILQRRRYVVINHTSHMKHFVCCRASHRTSYMRWSLQRRRRLLFFGKRNYLSGAKTLHGQYCRFRRMLMLRIGELPDLKSTSCVFCTTRLYGSYR